MAKKKGKAKKEEAPRINVKDVDISNLERAQMKSRINVLEREVKRKIKICDKLQVSVAAYRQGYEQEREEKDIIVTNLVKALEEARVESQKVTDTYQHTEYHQRQEVDGLQSKVKFLKDETENVRETLTEEIKLLDQKLKQLQEFGSETENISKRTQEAESQRANLVHQLDDDLAVSRKAARELSDHLKSQFVKILEKKAAELKQKFALRPDRKYMLAIEESVGLEDLVNILTELTEELEEENKQLYEENTNLLQQHKAMSKVRCKQSVQAQGLKEAVSLLGSQIKKNEEHIIIAEERDKDIQRHKECIEVLQSRFQNLKDKLNEAKEEWQTREADLKESEKQQHAEQEIYKKIVKCIRNIERIIKREISRPNLDTHKAKSLEKILAEMFSDDVFKRILKEDELSGFDINSCGLGYNAGSLGLTFNGELKSKKTKPLKKLDGNKCQTVRKIKKPPIVDRIAAKLLSELGLLSKFDIATVN